MAEPSKPRTRSLLAQALEAHEIRALRAFIYSRTSSDRHKRRTSTRDQETENRRTCADNGWTVAGSFEDPDLSASRRAKKSRPDYEAMVEGIKRGECDVIVFWDSSRAYRDLEVYVRLRSLCVEYGVLLCYNGEIFDMSKRSDRKRSAMDAVQSEDEADMISEKALRTKRLSAERGAPTGRIPYGYKRRYDPATGYLLGQEPDEPTAKIVREAMGRVIAGEALRFICADFQKRGIPTAHGAANGWQPPALRRILLNPAIVGQRVHQEAVIGKAAWKPIVQESDFRTVKKILTDPARQTQRDTAVKHLLSGIARCFCGGELRPVRNNRSGKLNYTCVANFCTAIEVGRLEPFVEIAVLAYLERPELARALEVEDQEPAVLEAMGVVDELESELAEARQLVGARKLSVASLASIEAQLLPQIEAARRAVAKLSRPSFMAGIAGPRARELWAEFDVSQRRAVLRDTVTITLNKARYKGVKEIEKGRVVFDWVR